MADAVKGRGRKSAGKKAAAVEKKQPGRGMGVAQLERIRMQDCWKLIPNPPPPPPPPTQHYYCPHQLHAPRLLLPHRAPAPAPSPFPVVVDPRSFQSQYCHNHNRLLLMPSIPNHHHCLDFNFKNKRVNGEEMDPNFNNSYPQGAGAEVVAVHSKGGRGDGKLVMEYGFFPPNSSSAAASSTSSASGHAATYPSTFIDLSLRL